ncbi:MAG: potassium transporter TrkG [Eubacteriales bacterium]|nr:potassium transporter TrkG [Eubacteriales bacterium]
MNLRYRSLLQIMMAAAFITGCFVLAPFIYAAALHDMNSAAGFITVAVICFPVSAYCRYLLNHSEKQKKKLEIKNGFLIVSLGFLGLVLISSFPYLLSGASLNFFDSWFESASGWTTTGSFSRSVSALSRPLLLWKAETCWLGGMGLVFLTTLIFPKLGINDQQLEHGCLSVSSRRKAMGFRSNRFLQTAVIAYLLFTVIGFFTLLIGGFPVFYAVINAMTGLSTSGILDPTAGGIFHQMPLFGQIVMAALSLLGSVNCVFFAGIFRKDRRNDAVAFETVFFLFLILITSAINIIYCSLSDTFSLTPKNIWKVFYLSVSFSTTSGFCIPGLVNVPSFVRFVLILLCIIGGCSYSQAGGIKIERSVIGFKIMIRGVYKCIHPEAIKPVLVHRHPISASRASSIAVYLFLFFGTFIMGFIFLSIDGNTLETTLCTSFAALSNTGISFGAISSNSYACYSAFGKIIASLLMIAGRLEIYPILFLFSRSFWNPRRSINK